MTEPIIPEELDLEIQASPYHLLGRIEAIEGLMAIGKEHPVVTNGRWTVDDGRMDVEEWIQTFVRNRFPEARQTVDPDWVNAEEAAGYEYGLRRHLHIRAARAPKDT